MPEKGGADPVIKKDWIFTGKGKMQRTDRGGSIRGVSEQGGEMESTLIPTHEKGIYVSLAFRTEGGAGN